MSRFPASLACLLGLALFSVGALMLLRFLTVDSLVDPSQVQYAGALRQGTPERVILGTYLFAIAFGFGIFCAGLAVLLGRMRSD